MIVEDFGPYVVKILHDHGNARFGGAENRITATFRRP